MTAPSPAVASVHAALAAQARKTAFREVKTSARAYIKGEAYMSADAVVAFRYLRAPVMNGGTPDDRT